MPGRSIIRFNSRQLLLSFHSFQVKLSDFSRSQLIPYPSYILFAYISSYPTARFFSPALSIDHSISLIITTQFTEVRNETFCINRISIFFSLLDSLSFFSRSRLSLSLIFISSYQQSTWHSVPFFPDIDFFFSLKVFRGVGRSRFKPN
jgi:hypothetical protein